MAFAICIPLPFSPFIKIHPAVLAILAVLSSDPPSEIITSLIRPLYDLLATHMFFYCGQFPNNKCKPCVYSHFWMILCCIYFFWHHILVLLDGHCHISHDRFQHAPLMLDKLSCYGHVHDTNYI